MGCTFCRVMSKYMNIDKMSPHKATLLMALVAATTMVNHLSSAAPDSHLTGFRGQYHVWTSTGVELKASRNNNRLTISCSMARSNSACGVGIRDNSMRLQKTPTADSHDDSFMDIASIKAGNKIDYVLGYVTGGFDPQGTTHLEYKWALPDQRAVGRYRCVVYLTCCAIAACMQNTVYSHHTAVVSQSDGTVQVGQTSR